MDLYKIEMKDVSTVYLDQIQFYLPKDEPDGINVKASTSMAVLIF